MTVREKGCKVSGSVVARGEDCHPNQSTRSTQLRSAKARREDDKSAASSRRRRTFSFLFSSGQ